MTGPAPEADARPDSVMAAVLGAVQAYLEDEERTRGGADARRLNFWKRAAWQMAREAPRHTRSWRQLD